MVDSRRNGWAALIGATFLLAGSGTADAVSFRVDETGVLIATSGAGVDRRLPFAIQMDPGPGGLNNALTYSLGNPPGLTPGDVEITEPPSGSLSDLVRFNANKQCNADGSIGCLVFYSDKTDNDNGAPLADIGFPTARYDNVITLPEIDFNPFPEGNDVTWAVCDLGDADIGISQQRLGNVVVGEFWRPPASAARAPSGGEARLGACPDQAALKLR
jgi:hypothetical protein